MKTTRCVLGALVLGGLFVLGGCGAGTYQIPNVEPVVKPKAAEDDDLLKELEGDEEGAPKESKGAAEKPAEKPAEAKPEAAKPETPAPAEATKAPEAPKPAAKPAEATKPAAAPAAAKPAPAKK